MKRRLTPRMADVLARMARANRPPLYTLSPKEARLAYEKGAGVLEIPKAELARVEDFEILARDGARLPVRLVAPTHEPLPTLLYLHGGGFTVGSIATHDTLCRALSAQAHCVVVSLDYRLAPEHKFPTAAHDAWDALDHLTRHGEALRIDTRRLAVGGDSAGGTLAAVTALAARDAGLPLALQLLFYPGTGSHRDNAAQLSDGDSPILDDALVRWFFSQYLRSDADRDDWRFAPMAAPEHEGVAPAWIGLAEVDPMLEDGIAYADRLRASGVPVDLEIYRGVTHEFIKMGRAIPEALQAHTDAARALRLAFETQQP